MGKRAVAVSVRVVTRSVVIDGHVMADDGDLVDGWRHDGNMTFTAQKILGVTIYPQRIGSAPRQSTVAAVNHDEVIVVLVADPMQASVCVAGLPKHLSSATPIHACAGVISVEGRIRHSGSLLIADSDGREAGLGRVPLSYLVDVRVRSLDATWPFESAAPFAILGAAGHELVAVA